MPGDFFGLFIPDQQIRILNPTGRSQSSELLQFLQSPGRDPFKQREQEGGIDQHSGRAEIQFDDFRWPIEPNRWRFLADRNVNRLCITELGGVGKSKLVEELEYLTAQLHPDDIVMRFNLEDIPVCPRQLLFEAVPNFNDSLFVGRFKNDAQSACPEHPLDFDEQSLLLNQLKRGKFTWILDGIDQVSESAAHQKMKHVVAKFLEWYPKIRCVIAGRPYSIQRIWDQADLGASPNGTPIWKFCILQRFSIRADDQRPSQSERYLPAEIWDAVQQLEADELSLPRTLNILRQMNVEDAREARTASEIYWRVQRESIETSLWVVPNRRQDITLTTPELMMMLGILSLAMLVLFESPVTEIQGEKQIRRLLQYIKASGMWARFDTQWQFSSQITFNTAFGQLPLLGESSIRFHAFRGDGAGLPSHLEITDATVRDFYAALFAAKYVDEEFETAQATELSNSFNSRLTKIFSYPEATSIGRDYERYWRLLVDMPPQVGSDETSSDDSFAQMVRPVLMSREKLRPTETMYRLWPELLNRAGYLSSEDRSARNEKALQDATTKVQDEVWTRVFGENFDIKHRNSTQSQIEIQSIDLSNPIKQLLFDFLSEYPKLYLQEIRTTKTNGVVTWFEKGFKNIPSGKVHYGEGDTIKTIENRFQLNAYQTPNSIYSLFDPNHWNATKKGDRSSGQSFGLSESFSPSDKHPVICSTWFDAWAFSLWTGGRLPEETEWEGAARGTIGNLSATRTEYYFGDNIEDTLTEAGLTHYACYYKNSNGNTVAVDQKRSRPESISDELAWEPHPYGLLNMHGNVWEWCSNWYTATRSRVVRGGSFGDGAEYCTCSIRDYDFPASAYSSSGFRVARFPGKS